MASGKEPWGDTFGRIFWNGTAPLSDVGGGNIVGTGIKAGQEVIYSKVIRKFMKADNRSWMGLIIFSLLTAAFDDGLGAWYGEHMPSRDQGFGDVLKEIPRPVLSCIAVNYIMATSYLGLHNPLKSFGFRELLIQLAAKDVAEGGLAILAQNMDNAKEKIAFVNDLQSRQNAASRLRRDS
jgi:hypothetical protein